MHGERVKKKKKKSLIVASSWSHIYLLILWSCDWKLDQNWCRLLLTITFSICFNCLAFACTQIWINKITSVTRQVTDGVLNFMACSTMRSFSHSIHSTTGCMQGNTKIVDNSGVVCTVRTDKWEQKNSHSDSCIFNDLMMAQKCYKMLPQ